MAARPATHAADLAKEAQESIYCSNGWFIEIDENGLYHQTDTLIGVKPKGRKRYH